MTSSCGNALDGASVNGGPWAAAILAQELVRESARELALLGRQGEKSANHAGPSPGSRPAAMGPMWWPSAKAAKGALAAAASAVAVRAGARLLARAVAGGPSASAAGRKRSRLAAAGSGSTGASPAGTEGSGAERQAKRSGGSSRERCGAGGLGGRDRIAAGKQQGDGSGSQDGGLFLRGLVRAGHGACGFSSRA